MDPARLELDVMALLVAASDPDLRKPAVQALRLLAGQHPHLVAHPVLGRKSRLGRTKLAAMTAKKSRNLYLV